MDGTIVVHGVDRVELAFVRFALVREAAADATAYGSLYLCEFKPICDKLGADLLLGISLLQVTRETRFGAFSRSSGILLYRPLCLRTVPDEFVASVPGSVFIILPPSWRLTP